MESKSKKQITKTGRAGLMMSVARIERKLRKGRYAERISTGAAVYLASVLEYLTAEVLELAGSVASDFQKRRIAPRHIMLGIEDDAELQELLRDVCIPDAGVMPLIHAVLLQKSASKRKQKEDLSIQRA